MTFEYFYSLNPLFFMINIVSVSVDLNVVFVECSCSSLIYLRELLQSDNSCILT